ncbi:hypothetical protein Tco_0522978 [Tanacetum coccineum]
MKELYDKVQESIKDSFKDFIPMDSEREKQMLKERDEKRLLRKRKAIISEEQPSKKVKLRTKLQVIDSPDGEYLIIHIRGEYLQAFDTLSSNFYFILHILDRQDLYHLYRVVQDYYEHIPPTIWAIAERRYPLSRELMIRMLEHGMEVEDSKIKELI